ncbi:MAG: hypothetical protein LBV18_04075 [Alistipes sp.]|jgi:hypothetical protein|nr:hypothetical protein [Alistipes sp.]
MKKVNFKALKVKATLKGDTTIVDGAESFADILYAHGAGIAAHALALKIYNSEGAVELTADEASLVEKAANDFCTPRFIDAIMEQLKSE